MLACLPAVLCIGAGCHQEHTPLNAGTAGGAALGSTRESLHLAAAQRWGCWGTGEASCRAGAPLLGPVLASLSLCALQRPRRWLLTWQPALQGREATCLQGWTGQWAPLQRPLQAARQDLSLTSARAVLAPQLDWLQSRLLAPPSPPRHALVCFETTTPCLPRPAVGNWPGSALAAAASPLGSCLPRVGCTAEAARAAVERPPSWAL